MQHWNILGSRSATCARPRRLTLISKWRRSKCSSISRVSTPRATSRREPTNFEQETMTFRAEKAISMTLVGCLITLGASLSIVGCNTTQSAIARQKESPMAPTEGRLPDLPGTLGVSGAYAGVSQGAFIVAGGTNFPGKMPWEGGAKVWHDDVYALDAPTSQWR